MLLTVYLYIHIGGSGGTVPSQQQLVDTQVQRFSAQGTQQEHPFQPLNTDTPAANESGSDRSQSLVDHYVQLTGTPSTISIGEGLPALSHRLIEKIKAGEYVDFSELPPAKGKGRASSQDWDSRILFLQVQQIENPRRLIPDFPTWAQCFALFATVKTSHQPSMVVELMAYMVEMAKYAKRFQWPSWVIYDQNFRQEMATRPGLVWSRADPGIFSQCFLGMANSQRRLGIGIAIQWTIHRICVGMPQGRPLVCSSLHLPALRRYAEISTLQKAARSSGVSMCTSALYVKTPMPRSIVTTVAVGKDSNDNAKPVSTE